MQGIQNESRKLQYLHTNLITEISHQYVHKWFDLKVKVLVDSFLQVARKVLMYSPHLNFGKVLGMESPHNMFWGSKPKFWSNVL